MPRRPPTVRALLPTLLAVAMAAAAGTAAAEPPAVIADSGRAQARQAFERFAEQWLAKMKRLASQRAESADGAARASYRDYGPDFTVELRPTGYDRAPYVGILRYPERLYRCRDARAAQCSVASTTRVTEIFRYQNGRWVH